MAGAPAQSGYLRRQHRRGLQQAAGQVWPGWGYGKLSQEAIWAATIDPGLTAGKTIVSMLPAWQTAITNYATSDGYTGQPLSSPVPLDPPGRARRARPGWSSGPATSSSPAT